MGLKIENFEIVNLLKIDKCKIENYSSGYRIAAIM